MADRANAAFYIGRNETQQLNFIRHYNMLSKLKN